MAPTITDTHNVNETVILFPMATSTPGWTGETTFTPVDPTDLKELAWIIPAVIAGTLIIVFIGLVCFYGIRATELYCMRCCYKRYGCCNPEEGEEYRNLKNNLELESYSLNGRYK